MSSERLMATLRIRVFVVFALVHAGLLLAAVAAARLSAGSLVDGNLPWLVAGIALLYAGFCFGVFFIVWPLIPLLRAARTARNGWERLVDDFPELLELLKKTIEAGRHFYEAWVAQKRAAAQAVEQRD